MYIPAFNRVEDDKKIDHLIEGYGFAVVVTQEEGSLLASHLPVCWTKETMAREFYVVI